VPADLQVRPLVSAEQSRVEVGRHHVPLPPDLLGIQRATPPVPAATSTFGAVDRKLESANPIR
jgi:hypothetical protein